MNYGIQMYSVRDFTDVAMDYTLSRVAEFQYEFVEFCHFYDYSAEEINEMLAKHNLRVSGAHVGMKVLKNELEKTLDFHEAIGNKEIIISGAEWYDPDIAKNSLETIKNVAQVVKTRGMNLHYHTHDGDYKTNKHGIRPLTLLENETDVLFETDTFWAYFAGLDPVAEIERLKDRSKFVHIKDGLPDRTAKSLGQGYAPVVDCVNKAKELGLTMIVESEGCVPDGIAEIKRCYKFLKKLEAGEL